MAVVRDCLAALAALHREGIVHGDVAPANVLFTEAGQPLLSDLGGARIVGGGFGSEGFQGRAGGLEGGGAGSAGSEGGEEG